MNNQNIQEFEERFGYCLLQEHQEDAIEELGGKYLVSFIDEEAFILEQTVRDRIYWNEDEVVYEKNGPGSEFVILPVGKHQPQEVI